MSIWWWFTLGFLAGILSLVVMALLMAYIDTERDSLHGKKRRD